MSGLASKLASASAPAAPLRLRRLEASSPRSVLPVRDAAGDVDGGGSSFGADPHLVQPRGRPEVQLADDRVVTGESLDGAGGSRRPRRDPDVDLHGDRVVVD